MRVKIEVEFEVKSDEEGLTEGEAKQAAELAAYHNLAFTDDNSRVKEEVCHHVDGFGHCEVSIPTD